MSLLRLPAEILRLIFDQIGSSFFREDLGRLTVCRQWLEFALPAYFKYITLSRNTLRSLIASEVIKKQSLLKSSLETIDLELSRYQHCTSTTDSPQESTSLAVASPNEASRDSLVKTWIKTLQDDLAQLATLAQQSHRLRTLCIRAWWAFSPEVVDHPEDHLPLAMQAFLSAKSLRVLKIDLSGSFLNSSGQQGNCYHICPAIGALLRTLRTLHLRMPIICSDALKLSDPSDSLHLSNVVINLSLTTGITAAAHSKRCGSQRGGLLQLKADIQKQAEALATRMASPKTVRILTHLLPSFEIQSLDVLTGKTMILDDYMEWDEDGKIVEEESEPESEISDADFSF